MIDLHYSPTANGQKISIALEELELPYNLIVYDIFEGDHHTAEFGRINPNHKVPAIVDNDPPFGGGPHAVFESCAILLYLAEKSGKLLPTDPRKRSVVMQWLFWQHGGLGPFGGQLGHFARYAPEKIPYAIERYTKEYSRLLTVMDRRLAESEYIGGDDYSIADIALWPGRSAAWTVGVDHSVEYPNIHRWFEQVGARPGVQRGKSDAFHMPPKYLQVQAVLTPEQWSNMFGEKMHGAVKL